MGLMSYIHRLLLKRGILDNFLPDKDDLATDTRDREAARVELEARIEDELAIRQEVEVAVRRLQDLNSRNHYGESLRRAFGGR